ncbi:MAG: hypothetical protein QXL32_05065 [Candidatus Bathyarchaeia archaeon]
MDANIPGGPAGREGEEGCKGFLRRIGDGDEEGALADFSIHSIMAVMDALGRLAEGLPLEPRCA